MAWPLATSSPAVAPAASGWRRRAYEIIFEHDTRAGRAFDVALLVAILLSMMAVMLETIPSLGAAERTWLRRAEYVFTALFTAEYVVRLLCVREPRAYALSFFGLVDLLAVLPTYISLLLPGAQSLLVIRGLRLLRMFRVLKLAHMAGEGYALAESLRVSRGKIVVFVVTVSIVVTIMGTAMYLVEGRENRAFRSIPDGMYWAIVTMATVGYGDAVPTTALGKGIAALIILIGYSLIVVPTGIVSAELASRAAVGALETAHREGRFERSGGAATEGRRPAVRRCSRCERNGHAADARFCDACGQPLDLTGS